MKLATTYEKYSDAYYFGTDSRSYRAKLFLSVTEYDTYVTIRVIGVTQMRYAYLYGVGIQVSGTGYTTQKVTGYLDSNPGSTWTNTTARTEDVYVTINKTSSVQTATYTAKAYGATYGDYGSAGGSGVSISYSVSIPALDVVEYDLTMSVSPSGAGYTSPSVGTHTYEDGTSVSISAYPYTGYEFSSWSINGIGNASYSSSTSVTVSGKDWEACAVFTKATYTISYNANGGYNAPSSQTKTHGTTLTLTTSKPSRSSTSASTGYTVTYNYNGGSGSTSSAQAADYYTYTFKNWNTNSSGTGTSYSSGGSYTTNASATLYAQWTSTLIDGDVTLPTPNSRTGYTFDGWYTSTSYTTKAGNAGASYTPSSSLTLYAKWTGNSYTVTYNGNGATSGSMSASSHTYGTSSALSANQFVKSGYKFLGWSTSSTATTATYTDGQSVSTLTSTSGGNVTLYAVWEQSGNVISVYDSDGVLHVGLVSAYDSDGVRHDVLISAYDSDGAKHSVT